MSTCHIVIPFLPFENNMCNSAIRLVCLPCHTLVYIIVAINGLLINAV